MKTPDMPEDESQRLQTLQSLHLLDTGPEERFDRLTRLARRVFGVPVALVSLIDENRQWFKSRNGLDITETPRRISFCGHAILGDDIFMVPDATLDERFADNPLVTGPPHVRFYAGMPLRAFDGRKMGTLCLIDHAPRSFTEDDARALRDLAAMAEQELAAIQLATLDELTRISNRRGFMMLGRYSLEVCRRQQLPATLVFIDLDNFKPVNDRFGHAEGDRALAEFARLLQANFRASDLVARIGGDEFVILLSDATLEQAGIAVEKFSDALAQLNRTPGRGYELAFSSGVVAFDAGRHASVDDLLQEGDALMYRMKAQRHGR